MASVLEMKTLSTSLMPYLLFAHPQQNKENKLNVLINLIIVSRIDGKLKHCKQTNNLMLLMSI